jgi:hypothetical protein
MSSDLPIDHLARAGQLLEESRQYPYETHPDRNMALIVEAAVCALIGIGERISRF